MIMYLPPVKNIYIYIYYIYIYLSQSLSAGINDASMWLKLNRLLLNPAKMEILRRSFPR